MLIFLFPLVRTVLRFLYVLFRFIWYIMCLFLTLIFSIIFNYKILKEAKEIFNEMFYDEYYIRIYKTDLWDDNLYEDYIPENDSMSYLAYRNFWDFILRKNPIIITTNNDIIKYNYYNK